MLSISHRLKKVAGHCDVDVGFFPVAIKLVVYALRLLYVVEGLEQE